MQLCRGDRPSHGSHGQLTENSRALISPATTTAATSGMGLSFDDLSSSAHDACARRPRPGPPAAQLRSCRA